MSERIRRPEVLERAKELYAVEKHPEDPPFEALFNSQRETYISRAKSEICG